MSRWITITKADLYNTKVAALIDAADTVMLGDHQSDRTTGVIADVTLEIRRKVARANQLDSNAAAIPGGLKTLALDLIFCRLKLALEMPLSEDERSLLKQRNNDLDRIADGKDLVDPPDNPIAANFPQAQAQPSFGTACRNFTDRTQNG